MDRYDELERVIVSKDQLIESLQENLCTLKLENEKQCAELNTKDILFTRKNERIEELVQQLNERDKLVQSKQKIIEDYEIKQNSLEIEIQELQLQLSKEEEDFTLLSAAMTAQQELTAEKNEQLVLEKEMEKNLQKEIERLNTMIRRLEKNVADLQPEMADVCLSPRSFSENQLIQLRDDAIQAKTKEIWLLTGQNDRLRQQMDEMESELDRLQTTCITVENDLARRDRKIEKLQSEIDALHVSQQQAQGREKAIEIAMTQNAKLLQALQHQECINEELVIRAERAETECSLLRHTQRTFLEKSAVNEVEVLHKTKEVEQKSNAVTQLQEKLNKERRILHQELTDARLQYQLEIEKLQSEVVMRRNKQYELTLRIQQVDGQLHTTTDELERVNEEFIATKCRMEEAERVLHDSLEWKRVLEKELETVRSTTTQEREEQMKELKMSQQETCALTSQLKQVKESLLHCMDQEKKKDVKIIDLRRSLETREHVIQEHKERMNRLIQQLTQEGQLRAQVEIEKQGIVHQLETLRTQMEDALQICYQQNQELQEKTSHIKEQYQQQEQEWKKEGYGKLKLMTKWIDAMGYAFKGEIWKLSCLELRECALQDHELSSLCCLLMETNPMLTRIDLRSNRFTHEGMKILLQYFRKQIKFYVREIDLRGNYISMEGIRTIASGLESMGTSKGIKTVMIKHGGCIECFSEGQQNKEIPMLSINIMENMELNNAVKTILSISGPISTFKFPSRRSIREEEGTLQDIYGVDLVQDMMGNEKSTARRKNITDKGVPYLVNNNEQPQTETSSSPRSTNLFSSLPRL